MGVFKEIPKADGSGITTFYRLDNDKDTVETTSTGGTETMIDYNKALNKPSINNVVLVGNKTLDELGIQPKGDYITEVPSEYITEEELNQKQYATESYVLDKIANIEHFSRQVVDELPLVGKDNVIYLVRKEGAGDDIYNEYIWTGTSYELFGSTATDLSDYYNKDSVNELLDTKVDKQEGKGLSTNDYTNAEKSKLASLENYDDSELRAAIDSLHNYDDTEIRQEIDKLSNESEAMSEKIEDIDKTNDYKLEAVRLIKSGDYWIWKDSADNLIDYFKARDLLGTENCILVMEQLDSDGKSMPADYKIDGDRIRILYKDLDNLNHEMYMGPPDKNTKTGNYIEIDNAAEASANKVKIYGETYQYTTTGQQLYNYLEANDITSGVSVDSDGWISISYDNSKGTSTKYFNYFTKNLDIETNTNYLIVTEIKKSSGNGSLLSVSNYGTGGQFKYGTIYKIEETSPRTYAVVNTTKDSFENTHSGLRTYVGFQPGQSGTIIFRLSVIKDTEINANNFIYEPYTGGKPSPSIDYPQDIKTCQGDNILPYPYVDKTKTINGITFVDNGDGSISVNGTATNNASFTLFGSSVNQEKILGNYLFGGSSKVWYRIVHYEKPDYSVLVTSKGNVSTPIDKSNFNTGYIELIVPKGYKVENEVIMPIMSIDKITKFEPYKSVLIKSENENLFNKDTIRYIQFGTRNGEVITSNILSSPQVLNLVLTYEPIEVRQGETVYISADIKLNEGSIGNFSTLNDNVIPGWKAIEAPIVSNIFQRYQTSFTYNKDSTINKVLIQMMQLQGTISIKNIKISKISNIEYTQYKNNNIPYSLKGNFLASEDYIFDDRLYKNTALITLDGREEWEYDSKYKYFKCPTFDFQGLIPLNKKNSQKSTHFIITDDWASFRDGIDKDGLFRINNIGYRICIRNTKITNIEDFKEFLSNNPIKIIYQLENSYSVDLETINSLPLFENYNYVTNSQNLNMELTYSTNTNYNENIILGDDSYYYGIVNNKQFLPEGKAKGTLCQTKDTKDFYIYNGEEWVPVDKTASFDLSNYLSKDNTTPYSPSDRYNPATKQYVDTNIQGLKIPTKVSQLENDSNYITENTNTLVNYYNKNNTYNKKEVDALIDSSGLTPVSITLNGQKTTDANFYAPTSGGTANQILISQGDAAPVWQNNTAVQTVNQDIKLVISDTQPEAPSSGFILWVDSTK